ncbi:MAG: TonB-dependent receptor [Saprospiraceae bacterium]
MRIAKLLLAALASLLLLFPLLTNAQNTQLTQTLKGTIKDKSVRTPLIGATVQLLVMKSGEIQADAVSMGAITDVDGYFRIPNVPVGKVALKVTYLGYKDAFVNNITVNSGKEVELNIEMEEDIISTKEVVISAKVEKQKALNELSAVSARTFSVEETKQFAAAVNDPARMASSFAGVVTQDDGNNTIVIRGNAPNGLLWRMEGVDIPAPNHFSAVGTSGGGISILSAQLLSNSDFITGAFASEYGNALSGVFDLKLRKGNQDKREYTFQAGVLGLDAAMEGPMRMGNQKGSFLVNYRYSTLSLLGKMGVNIGDAVTNFQDLSFNNYMPAGRFGSFTLFGMGGLSNQYQNGKADTASWSENFYSKYTFDFIANTGVLGLTHSKAWDKTFLKTVIAASTFINGLQQEEIQDDYSIVDQYDQRHTQITYTISSILSHKFNSRHFIRAGAYASLLKFDLKQSDFNWDDEVMELKLKSSGTSGTINSFAQYQYRASKDLTLSAGVHSLLFLLNNKLSLEPRASVKYALSSKSSISIGYGLHSQIQPIGLYFIQDEFGANNENKSLDMTKAHHLVLSFDQMLPGNMHLKTEAYYQSLYNAPVSKFESNSFSMLNAQGGFETQILDNSGFGKNYGLELTLEKFMTRGLYFLLSSSLYESKYQGSDGIWRNTRFNGKYANTLTAGKEWSWNKRNKNRSVGFNLKLVQLGGLRESPVDLEASRDAGYTVYDETRAFEIQVPDYFRLDIGFRLKRNYKHLTTTLGLDIQNTTNRQNVSGRYFDIETEEIVTSYQAPLIPVLFYRVEF